MDVWCVYALSSVYVATLQRADHSSKEPYRLWPGRAIVKKAILPLRILLYMYVASSYCILFMLLPSSVQHSLPIAKRTVLTATKYVNKLLTAEQMSIQLV
jgi:hypothetical protein